MVGASAGNSWRCTSRAIESSYSAFSCSTNADCAILRLPVMRLNSLASRPISSFERALVSWSSLPRATTFMSAISISSGRVMLPASQLATATTTPMAMNTAIPMVIKRFLLTRCTLSMAMSTRTLAGSLPAVAWPNSWGRAILKR